MAVYLVASKSYRWDRIVAFLDPWKHQNGKSYQLVQSLIAYGSGGAWGRGLGQGRQKLLFLPEIHTDFILSNVGEELGFLGVLAIIAMLALVVFIGLHQAYTVRSRFSSLLSAGIATLMGMEVVVNAGMSMSLLPPKGMALPFMSYGGTSTLSTFILVGLLFATGRTEDEKIRRHLARITQTHPIQAPDAKEAT